MREEQEPGRNVLEILAAVAAMAILVVCAISGLSGLGLTMHADQAKAREQNNRSIAQLQTRDNALETDLANMARLLQTFRSDLAKLAAGHDTLGTQVTTTAAKLKQLEATVQQTGGRVANSGDAAALQQVAKQRDEALAQSKLSDDQIRQLTLKLQKAGVYP
jgi:septal ring factor EnvC (AmiA/AmiB activator)